MSPARSSTAPVLLTIANFYGTLAAVRCLGRAGITVAIADASLSAPACWSKFVARRLSCPSLQHPDLFMEWLLDFGVRSDTHVLVPTSDDTAWLYSLYREQLQQHFCLYQPSVDVVYTLLNKRRLLEQCQHVGLDVPRSWFPESAADLRQVAREAHFPVLIKPVTQILNQCGGKGVRIDTPARLLERFPRFKGCSYPVQLLRFDPSASQPIVQEFFAEAADNIYSLSGFIDESGAIRVLRAGVKVLQRPRQLGIGLCFEPAPLHPQLVEGVVRLAISIGYHGVFEVEFVRTRDRFLLIDFNPRFYSQMAFDIARGLPLPLFAYYAALGQRDALESLDREQQTISNGHNAVFADRLSLELLLLVQRLSGALSRDDALKWRRWYELHREHCTDAVLDRSDWLPAVLDAARGVATYARHPKGFVRSIVLNR